MAACLRCLQVDLQDKSVKMSFCPFWAYAGVNDLSYLNHIIIVHYNASYGCRKCLKQAFVLSSALHNHKKVCLRFTKKPAAGSNSKLISGSGGDGSQGSSSTRATPKKKDSKTPATNSQGSSTPTALQMTPCHSRCHKSYHSKPHKDLKSKKDLSGDKKKKKHVSPTGKGSGCTNTVANVRPTSPITLLSHQHVPVSVIFLILVFSQINYFCCKTRVPVII